MAKQLFKTENGKLQPGEDWNDYINADRSLRRLNRIGIFLTGTTISTTENMFSAVKSLNNCIETFAEAVEPPFDVEEREAFNGSGVDGSYHLWSAAANAVSTELRNTKGAQV
jgi:hypothetical protein